jgi:plasmid stabilization system protein ParE
VMAYNVSDRGDGEIIYILRVIHTARDWPNERWPT